MFIRNGQNCPYLFLTLQHASITESGINIVPTHTCTCVQWLLYFLNWPTQVIECPFLLLVVRKSKCKTCWWCKVLLNFVANKCLLQSIIMFFYGIRGIYGTLKLYLTQYTAERINPFLETIQFPLRFEPATLAWATNSLSLYKSAVT